MNPAQPPTDPALAAAKQELRRSLIGRRRSRAVDDRRRSATANAAHLRPLLETVTTVCAYLPLPSEPLDPALLDELAAAGVRVLVPVVTGAAPLDWTDYTAARAAAGPGPLPRRPGPVGIEQLDAPRLGPAAVAQADIVLVPALAVGRGGFRLGRGGGHYDRTLALSATLSATLLATLPATLSAAQSAQHPRLVAVLDDGEMVDEVPHDHLDVPVTHVVTPTRGLRPAP